MLHADIRVIERLRRYDARLTKICLSAVIWRDVYVVVADIDGCQKASIAMPLLLICLMLIRCRPRCRIWLLRLRYASVLTLPLFYAVVDVTMLALISLRCCHCFSPSRHTPHFALLLADYRFVSDAAADAAAAFAAYFAFFVYYATLLPIVTSQPPRHVVYGFHCCCRHWRRHALCAAICLQRVYG